MRHMGLRAKLGLLLFLSFLGLAFLSATWLHNQLVSSHEEEERTEATQGMVRLLRTLETQVVLLDNVADEWSNWTELYNFMSSRSANFLTEYLSPDSLRSSRLTLMQIRDKAGQEIALTEIPNASGKQWISAFLHSNSLLYQSVSPDSHSSCGLSVVSADNPVLLHCDHPIYQTTGKSASQGRLMTARPLDEEAIATIGKITQLRFRFELFDKPGQVFDGAPAIDLSPMQFLGVLRTPQLSESPNKITVAFPMHGLANDTHYGWLYLDYPRVRLAQVRSQATQTSMVLALLIVLTTLLAIVAIDRLVVQRLLNLQREVESATGDIDWKQRVSTDGNDELGNLAHKVNALLALIQTQVQQLNELSLTDSLTGLPNRRAFEQRLELAVKRQQREGTPMALLIIDIDFFKKYNDRYGHPAGDKALQQVASALHTTVLRGTDLAARMGGEEFALLLENTDARGALDRAQSALAAVKSLAVVHEDNPPGVVTISIGLALLDDKGNAESLYKKADDALYQAKQEGRNRVVHSLPHA